MKRFAGLAVSAGLVFAATAANAQMLAPFRAVSDFEGPYERHYGAVSPAPPPVYNYGGYGPPAGLMPMPEVYAVLRDNGFSPLGAPHQRGFVYTIAVMDRNGEDGRLVIDGRNGRIIRFVPAWGPGGGPGWGPGGGPGWGRGPGSPYDESFNAVPGYGSKGALPPPSVIGGVPRPPASVPHVGSRTVPLPAPKPAIAGKPPEAVPQRAAAIEPKPEVRPATPPAPAASAQPPAASTQTAQTTPPAPTTAAPPAAEAKPAPVIRPTQAMPAAQGLE